ncbi:DNA-binding protein [Cellulomonas triticagri]|uniref:DNA-binding protein n=1 Tax=Cellulomonas triticagri TaxID=2483352 RepID=A0A3M2JR69_9CELL|nr:DNA-binding protein [Cellulomonas triticagri]
MLCLLGLCPTDLVRTATIDDALRRDGEDLLTTGEAARLLGVSRQHVVDLTARGDLPYETVGTHRRVRRRDLERVRFSTSRVSADQRRALRLAYAVAGKIAQDPDGVRRQAQQNLTALRARHARGRPAVWLAQWQDLLDGPVDDLLDALTSPSQRSRELRQNSPFAGVLTEDERAAVLREAR